MEVPLFGVYAALVVNGSDIPGLLRNWSEIQRQLWVSWIRCGVDTGLHPLPHIPESLEFPQVAQGSICLHMSLVAYGYCLSMQRLKYHYLGIVSWCLLAFP